MVSKEEQYIGDLDTVESVSLLSVQRLHVIYSFTVVHPASPKCQPACHALFRSG
jgi:hypothetical protein